MFGSFCYHVNTFHLLCAHDCLISCDRGRIFRPLSDRAEVIGTLISIATMWIMTVWLVYEATERFFKPPEI